MKNIIFCTLLFLTCGRVATAQDCKHFDDLTGIFLDCSPAEILVAEIEDTSSHPLKETMKWTIIPLSGYIFDHSTSIYWSSHPSNCTEGNSSRRNDDGTLDGWKATKDEIIGIGIFAGTLYIAKKFHWRYLEIFAKSLMISQAVQSSYYGFESVTQCHRR